MANRQTTMRATLERIQQANWGIRGITRVLADDINSQEPRSLALQHAADLHCALTELTRRVDHMLEDLLYPAQRPARS